MTPNKPGLVFEPGVARLLRGNSDIVMQMHYTTNGKEATDRTTIGVIYAKQPPTKMAAGGMAINPRFVIPAGDGNARSARDAPLTRATRCITAFTPHMHVRGKDMTYIAHYPDGTRRDAAVGAEVRLQLADHLRAGEAEAAAEGHHARGHRALRQLDRATSSIPDPTKDVRWGDQTWEEMMIGFFSTVQPPAAASATPQP